MRAGEQSVPFGKLLKRAVMPRLRRLCLHGATMLGMLLGLWLLSTLAALGDQALRQHAPAADAMHVADWGSEALGEFPDAKPSSFLIRIANACGLGSSSCVRCHDGKRAAAPPAAATTGPWHRDHARVPYSCAGCHEGNPRVMRQDTAHRKMVTDPLQAPEQHCRTCHKADAAALARRYRPNPPSPP